MMLVKIQRVATTVCTKIKGIIFLKAVPITWFSQGEDTLIFICLVQCTIHTKDLLIRPSIVASNNVHMNQVSGACMLNLVMFDMNVNHNVVFEIVIQSSHFSV